MKSLVSDTASVNSDSPADTDQLREEFRAAFIDYVIAGRRLHELLVKMTDADRPERSTEIVEHQRVLNEMQQKYNQARSSYVGHILTGIGVA